VKIVKFNWILAEGLDPCLSEVYKSANRYSLIPTIQSLVFAFINRNNGTMASSMNEHTKNIVKTSKTFSMKRISSRLVYIFQTSVLIEIVY